MTLGHRSLKVIGTDTDHTATYDFLLTLHSNHEPVSYRFRDKRQFQSKIAFFPPPCIYAPAEEWELCTDARDHVSGLVVACLSAVREGSNRVVGSCVYRTTTAIYSLGHGLCAPLPRSTQPSTLRGTVNEYQLSG